MLPIKSPGLSFYVDRLKTGERYSLARYGNGEWDCIFKSRMRTGSGSQLLKVPGLRQGLIDSLVQRSSASDTYFLGIQSPSYLKRCQLWDKLVGWQQVNCPGIHWHNGNVFHYASMRSTLYPLIEQLRKMELIIVGPPWLEGLKKVFPSMKFVYVRPKNCFATYKDIRSGIVSMLKTCKAPVVVSFSAGPATKVLINSLHDKVRDGCYLIDFGSLWDIYAGKQTRRYHKRVTRTVRKCNLTGRKA